MINMPIYRAKKLDSDKYVEGYYIPNNVTKAFISDEEEREEIIEHFLIKGFNQDLECGDENYYNFWDHTLIDPTTLAISFPNMIDINNKRIFASLDYTNCIGGDIITGNIKGVIIPLSRKIVVYFDELYNCVSLKFGEDLCASYTLQQLLTYKDIEVVEIYKTIKEEL